MSTFYDKYSVSIDQVGVRLSMSAFHSPLYFKALEFVDKLKFDDPIVLPDQYDFESIKFALGLPDLTENRLFEHAIYSFHVNATLMKSDLGPLGSKLNDRFKSFRNEYENMISREAIDQKKLNEWMGKHFNAAGLETEYSIYKMRVNSDTYENPLIKPRTDLTFLDHFRNFATVLTYHYFENGGSEYELVYNLRLTYDSLIAGAYPMFDKFGLLYDLELTNDQKMDFTAALHGIYCFLLDRRRQVSHTIVKLTILEMFDCIFGLKTSKINRGLVMKLLDVIRLRSSSLANVLANSGTYYGIFKFIYPEVRNDVCQNSRTFHFTLLQKVAHNSRGAGKVKSYKRDFVKAFLVDRYFWELEHNDNFEYDAGELFVCKNDDFSKTKTLHYSQNDVVRQICEDPGLKELSARFYKKNSSRWLPEPDYDYADKGDVRLILRELEEEGLIKVSRDRKETRP